MRDAEEQWMRRWLLVFAALSAAAAFLPGTHVTWHLESGRPAQGTMGGARLAQFVPLWWLIAAFAARSASWGPRALILMAAATVWPALDVVDFVRANPGFDLDSLIAQTTHSPLATLRTFCVLLAMALIAAVVHGRARGLPGRRRRWLWIGAFVVLVSLSERVWNQYGIASCLRRGWYDVHPRAGNEPLFAEFVVGVTFLGLYTVYVLTALLVGVTGSVMLRRVVAIASRAALPALLVLSIPWQNMVDHRHGDGNIVVLGVGYGARWAAEYMGAALALASLFEVRNPHGAIPSPDAFE